MQASLKIAKMSEEQNLARFVNAQEGVYTIALNEIKRGRKTSHWMWYIFPQIRGLGYSDTAIKFAIKSKSEATEYLQHPVLGNRLVEISSALLNLATNNAVEIFGHVDSLKLKSCMTLFSLLENTNPVFQKVLDKFFKGEKDSNTIALINP